MERDYFEGADVAVTICAKDGTILDMNAKSRKTFIKPGMPEIIGQNVLDCHPESARSLLADMLENPRTNVYTVEKEGVKKLIFQTPWYDGEGHFGKPFLLPQKRYEHNVLRLKSYNVPEFVQGDPGILNKEVSQLFGR